MLPKHVVATLQAGRHYAEQYSQVTVLFADIISYTSMSSEMTPDELVGLLSRCGLGFTLWFWEAIVTLHDENSVSVGTLRGPPRCLMHQQQHLQLWRAEAQERVGAVDLHPDFLNNLQCHLACPCRLYGHYDTMCATHGMFKVRAARRQPQAPPPQACSQLEMTVQTNKSCPTTPAVLSPRCRLRPLGTVSWRWPAALSVVPQRMPPAGQRPWHST